MTTPQRSATVAWVVFAHRDADHLRRLVRCLSEESAGCEVVIHLSTTGELSPDDMADIVGPQVRFAAERHQVFWGDASLWKAIRSVLDDVVHTTTRDWVAIVPGDVAPVRPVGELSDYLAGTAADGVLSHRIIPQPAFGSPLTENQKRYFYRYFRMHPSHQPEPRTAARLRWAGLALSLIPGVAFRAQRRGTVHQIGFRRWRSVFDEDVPCVKGGPFGFFRASTLRRTLLQNPRSGALERHFARSVLPDEAALATMTVRDTSTSLADHDLIAGFWEASAAHPGDLTIAQAQRLFGDRGVFFSRKTSFADDLSAEVT